MTVVVDYGASNIRSVCNAFEELGEEVTVADRPDALDGAERIVLPGVGAMAPAMARLREAGLDRALDRAVRDEGVPFLGICLGMQMMCRRGCEGGVETEGLGWIDGEVLRLEAAPPDWRVPNMGWSEIAAREAAPVCGGLRADAAFYFCHSYHARLDDPAQSAATLDFDGPVTAAVWRGNAFGVQFHPERSGNVGQALLEAFLEWDGGPADAW